MADNGKTAKKRTSKDPIAAAARTAKNRARRLAKDDRMKAKHAAKRILRGEP